MRRVDVKVGDIDVTLAWGDPAEIKAAFRDEAEARYRALPLAERLRIALSMVQRRPRDERSTER